MASNSSSTARSACLPFSQALITALKVMTLGSRLHLFEHLHGRYISAKICKACSGCFPFSLVLITALISFPMLVDRRVGLPLAVATSVEVAWRNPITVAVWGMIVAALLTLGFVTLFVGLIFVLPILGHATWHLYRRAVAPPEPAAKAPVSEA